MLQRSSSTRLPAALLPVLALGAFLALAGGHWDDAWHTERGRDSFFIAPHLASYGGVTVAGGGLAAWILAAVRRGGVAAASRERALRLAGLAVVVTLASAPIDNAWHVAFGRDAVIWSPPHVLGIVGTTSLAIAVLTEIVRGAGPPIGRWLAAGLALAGLSFLVVEYETDVPQFAAVWYLPVLALAASLALALVRAATGEPFAATRTAAAHLAFMGLVSLFLVVQGFDAPQLPLLLVPAMALDLAAKRGTSDIAQAAVFGHALIAVTVVAALAGHGVTLHASDILVDVPLVLVASWLPLRLTSAPVRRPPAPAAIAVLALATLLVAASAALAHDPGQGPEAGTVAMRVAIDGTRATVSARPDPAASGTAQLVARRAGVVRRTDMRRAGSGWRGALHLDQRGRWFFYVTFHRSGERVESWLPAPVGSKSVVFDARRFAYAADRRPGTAVKSIAGVALYALVATFLLAVVRLVRATAGVAPAGQRRPRSTS